MSNIDPNSDYNFAKDPLVADLLKGNSGYNIASVNYRKRNVKVDKLTDTVCTDICNGYGITRDEELEDKVESLVLRYQSGEIDEKDFAKYLENIVFEKTSTATTGTGSRARRTAPKDDFTDVVIDIEPDDLGQVASICGSIKSSLDGATITVPAKAQPYAAGVIAASKLVTNISSSLDGFKGVLVDTLNGMEENDVDYNAADISFEEMGSLFKSGSSKMMEATEAFFKNNPDCEIIDTTESGPITIFYVDAEYKGTSGYAVLNCSKESYTLDDGKYAAMEVDGRMCYYNLKTHNFYVDGFSPFKGAEGTEPLNATVFVPSKATDYSNLNTYTYFVQYNAEDPGYSEHIKDLEGDVVAIRVHKNGGEPKDNPWDKFDEIGYMTKFVNNVAYTSLDDGKCHNIVGGDSAYGTFAMRVASYYNKKDENGERNPLYDSVYCVNNAIIATGINNNGGDKRQMTQQEVADMDGLNVFFISASGDPNLVHNRKAAKFDSKIECKFNESYEYTGLIYLLAMCPNVKAYMLYPELGPKAHNGENEIGAYIALQDHPISKDADGNQRYFYNGTWLEDVAIECTRTDKNGVSYKTRDYETHSDGNTLITELFDFLFTRTGELPKD